MKILIKLESLLLAEALRSLFATEDAEDLFLVDDGTPPSDWNPDIVIIDAGNLARALPWPQAKVIVLDTGLKREEIITLFLLHNPDGIISTEADSELARKALKLVHEGQVWIDHSSLKSLIFTAGNVYQNTKVKKVSPREQDILEQVRQGKTNREIADHLCISEQTVKSHLSRIFKKFNVTTRHQLMSQLANLPDRTATSGP